MDSTINIGTISLSLSKETLKERKITGTTDVLISGTIAHKHDDIYIIENCAVELGEEKKKFGSTFKSKCAGYEPKGMKTFDVSWGAPPNVFELSPQIFISMKVLFKMGVESKRWSKPILRDELLKEGFANVTTKNSVKEHVYYSVIQKLRELKLLEVTGNRKRYRRYIMNPKTFSQLTKIAEDL